MNKIEPQYVTFEIAKLLKEKDFNEMCRVFWGYDCTEEKNILIEENSPSFINNRENNNLAAPEIWQVVEWFWEVYLIDISIIPFREKGSKSVGFQYRVINFSDPEIDEVMFEHQYNRSFHTFFTRKEAYLAAIDYILKELI